MRIAVAENLELELINENHPQAIFELVDSNRTHLREWLPFVDQMQSVEFAENFVRGTCQRNESGQEFAFVIILDDKLVGRIGVYKIDPDQQTGEIGYWLAESAQGKGIATQCCAALIDFCFTELQLQRLEIRCGTHNLKSQSVPKRLHFSPDQIIPQGEWLHEQWIDLQVYVLWRG